MKASQIELTTSKKDYSPVVTTAKYDLRRIYNDPISVSDPNNSALVSQHEKSEP